MVDQVTNGNPAGFSSEWLTLREPADHDARSESLTRQLADWACAQPGLTVIEMGCGTGSNFRFLCPHLGHGQEWTLFDHDEMLLTQLPISIRQWAGQRRLDVSASANAIEVAGMNFSARLRWQQADLANELHTLPFESAQLITASALLDLTSQAWLQQLAEQCISHQCASLFVLNYDGRISWQPEEQYDVRTMALLNRHQLGNKGFGPAMGPQAGQALAKLLSRHQQCQVERSDWQIGPRQQALQQALLAGWLAAAEELAPAEADALEQWHAHRLDHIASMESSLDVGHTDILSLPLSAPPTTS
ncbi:class I SAM-dependent methyltransferase [Granulosicoccus sp. 3-233]|uniref:class I SAM-dependent methyltransferase n=1 Tax=Granulosicoccus sp. 3-233 TaxID=3417969 RepID=UPI003D3312FE